jgi:hypothetical protein
MAYCVTNSRNRTTNPHPTESYPQIGGRMCRYRHKVRARPSLIITLQDKTYLSELRERVNAIKTLTNEMRDEAVA